MADPPELFLPRVEQAVVPAEKLRDYALDPTHGTGRHKARVFAAMLGIGRADWVYLREQILDRVGASPVTAVRPKPPYGVEYEVRIEVDGLNGETGRIITGWLVPDDGPPRLTSVYVELRRRG